MAIVVDPAVAFGKPVIAGTRVSVETVTELLAAGETVEAIVREYDITPQDVRDCLAYATEVLREQRVAALPL